MKARSRTRKKYLFPLSVRTKMATAKRGRPLSQSHREAIARGMRRYYAKAVLRG
jgi:hypothetical protein